MERTVRPDADLSLEIIEAVADVTGRPPDELQPFAESIDADAVATLFDQSSGDGVQRLELTYEGCHVSVDRETVTVEPIAGVSPASGVPDERDPAYVGLD